MNRTIFIVSLFIFLAALIPGKTYGGASSSTGDKDQTTVSSSTTATTHTTDTAYRPQGYVPDAETAIRIAEEVWFPMFGKDTIEKQKPYKVSLVDGFWFVEGTLPDNALGGTVHISISQDDGTVLRAYHTR